MTDRLPPKTLRALFIDDTVPTSPDGTWTQVSISPNIWDFHRDSDDWGVYHPNTEGATSVLDRHWYADSGFFLARMLKVIAFNSTGITNMGNLFTHAWSLTELPSTIDTSSLRNMDYMFRECLALQEIPIMDTSNVETMQGTFASCWAITRLPYMDTTKVTNMNEMCLGCDKLVYFPQLITSNVVSFKDTFRECSALTDLPTIDTVSAFTTQGMFYDCLLLEDVNLTDTSNVVNMDSMFAGCSAMTAGPSMNTSNVTSMNAIFINCSAMSYIPTYDTSKVTDMRNMLRGCGVEVIPSFSADSVTNVVGFAQNATKVKSGALVMYNKFSSKNPLPTYDNTVFMNCGSDTVEGAAELAQIPESWGGTQA